MSRTPIGLVVVENRSFSIGGSTETRCQLCGQPARVDRRAGVHAGGHSAARGIEYHASDIDWKAAAETQRRRENRLVGWAGVRRPPEAASTRTTPATARRRMMRCPACSRERRSCAGRPATQADASNWAPGPLRLSVSAASSYVISEHASFEGADFPKGCVMRSRSNRSAF